MKQGSSLKTKKPKTGGFSPSSLPSLHLVCNAHLDPVWLWEWQEGAAEAIATFRSAAELCEQFDGFVFNHNEVILYEWVEEYDPDLFLRIQRLVREGRWHIMGGWFLQPDCNMPSGESIVRQILVGRPYFAEKFGARPTTAINFDPFGHSRGLVQILAKAGFDSYLICRPMVKIFPLESNLFTWVGLDGSEVTVYRSPLFYLSAMGEVQNKYEDYMKNHAEKEGDVRLLMWGAGNHGGGPSRADIQTLNRIAKDERGKQNVVHSTPEQFFADAVSKHSELPRVEIGLNPFAVGCYTSMVRVKQKHRELENELFLTEKMATTAALNGVMKYPRQELADAQRDLLTAQFHDILPGSAIQPAEETSIRLMDHGIEILSRVKARAYFALAAGQPKVRDGLVPILAYNPHPHTVTELVECEFMLPNGNYPQNYTDVVVTQNGRDIPSQLEHELSNIPFDWRKRVVFRADLAAGQMSRFDCRLIKPSPRPKITFREKSGKFSFKTDELDVIINARTGLIDRYRANGVDYLRTNAFRPIVFVDNEDPWGMTFDSIRETEGAFEPASPEESARLSGVVAKTLPAVRVVEDGVMRTVIEAVMVHGRSHLVLTYKLPKVGTEVEVTLRVYWLEKDRMLKLSIPSADKNGRYIGQVMYGRDELYTDGRECVSQKWVAAVSDAVSSAVTLINEGVYGSSFRSGEILMTLLRSPAYSAHPVDDMEVMRPDAFSPRIDQGERFFRFWLNAGPSDIRLDAIDREALVKNEKPVVLSFSPSGAGKKPLAAVQMSAGAAVLSAMKFAEKNDDVILRLHEPTGKRSKVKLKLPAVGALTDVTLASFEIKTLRVTRKGRISEEDLIEGL